MSAYIFVIASILSVVPVILILKMTVKQLIENPDDINQIFKRFYTYIALSKIAPVVLLIIGMVNIEKGVEISSLYVPLAIILLVVTYALSFISSQKSLNIEENTQDKITLLATTSRPLILSIPVMSVIFIFMMTM